MKIIPLFIGSAMLLLTSCASKPPAVLSTGEMNTAVETILKETVYYNTLFNTCARLGGDQEITAIDKQQDWLNANIALVSAANANFNQQIAASVINYGGKSISPIAVRLALEERQRALNELKLEKRTYNNQRKTCDFRLGKITATNIHLVNQPAIAIAYTDIMKLAPAVNVAMQSVPTLTANIALNISPGRTYYSVNKALEKECADNHLTITLANDWPNEAYANFCGNKLLETLICEWGNCEVKKL